MITQNIVMTVILNAEIHRNKLHDETSKSVEGTDKSKVPKHNHYLRQFYRLTAPLSP